MEAPGNRRFPAVAHVKIPSCVKFTTEVCKSLVSKLFRVLAKDNNIPHQEVGQRIGLLIVGSRSGILTTTRLIYESCLPSPCRAEVRTRTPADSTGRHYSRELRIASSRRRVGVGVRAQRTQVSGSVGHADHGQGASLMLAVERCRLGHVERASIDVGIVGVVEPEAHVEGINRHR